MSEETHETETETTPAHAASTLPPASEEEGLSDAELSAKRGLSHRDGPMEPPLGPHALVRKVLSAAAAKSAKGGKAP
jgi:hypothetical protein